jgi:hypothetical protein
MPAPTRARPPLSALTRRSFAIAVVLFVGLQAASIVCASSEATTRAPSAGVPVILDAQPSVQRGAPRSGGVVPAPAVVAANAFVEDYAQMLRGRLDAIKIRAATADFRQRIAASRARAAGEGGVHVGAVRVEHVARGVVRVSARVRAGSVVQHLRFVLARTSRGWLVDDMADPESP